MASQLASQLQKLQQRPVGDKRLSQSFLFDASEARSFSREQIHQLAVHGLQTLIAIDNRFHPFVEELFHPYKTRVERKLLGVEENRALDATLEQFLTLLSPHMFLTAAHQVFEYLVRVHEVHVHNVEAVLRTFLPYHDHSLFARAVMLLDLRDTGFDFLERNQEHGAPLVREHLVLACAESRRALRTVCLTLAMSVRMKVHNGAAIALFAGVAVRLASHPDAEALWRVLLPFVVEFLSGAVSGAEKGDAQQELRLQEDTQGGSAALLLPSREVVCGALVVLAAWSNEVQLSVPTLATVVKPIVRFLTRASDHMVASSSSASSSSSVVVPTSDLLAVLDLLFYTQRKAVTQVTFSPHVRLLLALPWKQWAPWITDAAEEAANAGGGMYDSLIAVLLRQCLQRLCVSHSLESVAPDVLHFVHCAVNDLPLTEALVAEVIQALMTCHLRNSSSGHRDPDQTNEDDEKEETAAADAHDARAKGGSAVTTWMGALERRFAHAFDATLSRLLNGVTTQAATAAFLAQHLSGTRYELLEVQGPSGKTERLPLFSCLLHPLPEVRLLAAKAMDGMTVHQLITSSSAPGSGGAGNSLLELLEHVVQYEQSHKVAEQFLHTAAAAMEKLLALLVNEEAEEVTTMTAPNGGLSSMQQDIVIPHMRNMLRSLWVMATQHGISVQKDFLGVALQPLLRFADARLSKSSSGKRNKRMQKSSNEADASRSLIRGFALYYVTLQYVDAVHQESTGEFTNGAAEENADAGRRLRELIVELEGRLTAVVPGMGRTAGFLTAAADGAASSAEKNEAAQDSSDDEANEAHDDMRAVKRTEGPHQVTRSPTAAGGVGNSGYLSVFDCVPLLESLRAEAHARLRPALAQLRGTAEQGEQRFSRESRSTMVECCLACASQLATSEASEADAVIRVLLAFFVGENNVAAGSGTGSNDSYLGRLRDAQRAALRQVKERVGRGAKNSLVTPYVPKDELTAGIGAVVRCSIEARLRNDSCTCDEVAVWERMARLLGYLSTPLPAVAMSPIRLPPVYLRLLEPTDAAHEEERFPVDWFGLVYTSVFRTRGCMLATGAQPFSLSALSLTFFCPLAAPTGRKESLLQEIQNLVLTATQGKSGSTRANGAVTGAQMAVESALRVEHISATTLSAIIEFMAREDSRRPLIRGAAELLCRMMAGTCEEQKEEPIVPFFLSRRALEHFFPLRGKATRGEGATSNIAMEILLPALKSILATGGSISNTATATATTIGSSSRNNSKAAVNDAAAAAVAVTSASADFLHAACLRAEPGAPSDDGEDAFLQLCLALIQHPFLRVVGGRVRPVYRHALTAFANALSRGLEGQQSNSVLFIPRGRAGESSSASMASARGSNKAASSEKYLQHLAATVSHALLSDPASMNRLGGDATLLLAGTLGGYHRLFMPWVSRLLQQPSPDLSVVVDVVEALAAPATEMADAWEPPSWCALHNPLVYADARRLLQLCGKVCDASQGGKDGWCPRDKNALLALRLLCSLITVSPSIHFDDDNDDDDVSPSLFTLIDGLLESFPLSGLLSLLAEADDADEPQFHRWAFVYIRNLVDLCVSSPQALNEGQVHGAARISRTLVRQCVTLMAALLVPDVAAAQCEGGEEEGEGEATALSRHRIHIISELLRIVSPLFVPAPSLSVAGSAGSPAAGRTALHIPVVALLIRLEAVDFTSAHHRYESAMDVCSSLLASFDVHTQLSCLTQMMHLLINPHEQLSLTVTRRQGEEEEEEDAVIRLFRKLVKPNQVVNRQEMILHLINITVKSEAFLGGFLELQHHQHASRGSHAKQDGDENETEEQAAAVAGTRTNDECMAMLVATLELFAHYAELNAATANDVAVPVPMNEARKANWMREELPEYGENKAFTVLLELLAGNTLACVLAGINEATFVACLERLLTDQRVALQQKGLEVLLDRLHHALPTVENTLSESEVEEHRGRLRDPKQKLTLMDLVRVKARPLATKRSFALFPHLLSLMHVAVKSPTTQATGGDLLCLLPLIVGSMEELVRIISSGGSLQAEKTLLNVHRANRVTEATLSKLFGNKARVQSVHRWVEDIVTVLPLLLSGEGARVPAERTVETGGGTLASSREENTLLAAAALLTALGTVCQVMGTAFTTPHSNNILQAVVEAAVFAVVRVAPVVSCSETGSLLRQASLGCLLRVFPSCWLMCQPYLSRIIFAATHLHNVDDAETNYRSAETLTMLEAVLEPHLFIEACTECLRGVTVGPDATSKRHIRVRVDTHSFSSLYTSVRRRVEGLKREELMHLHVLVEGTTTKDNFWLASLHALATAPSLPSSDIVEPVLDAYMAFFLKFKAKQCVRYLSTLAEWAFGGAAEHFLSRVEKQQQQRDAMELRGDTHERDDAALVPRTTVHGWVLFYALCNHMLEKLGSIMDFGFPVLLPYVVGTLTGYCSATRHAMQHAAGLIARTLEGALDSVRRMALAQTAGPDHDHSVPMDNYLETPEVFSSVMPAVVRQLSNLSYLADATHDYAFRAEHHVIPAVRALFQSLTSSKLQSRTQNELLKALRHPSRHVRRMALLCFDGIYADGGDELASRLMAEMLPAVVEMTEDRDDDVVEQARTLCNKLSAITGQDVLYAMSS